MRSSLKRPGLGVLFNGLSIEESGLGCVLLSHCVQQPIVARRYLVNDLPVGVVEGKIRRQKFGLGLVDCAAALAKIKNQVIEIQRRLKEADGLSMPFGSVQGAVTRDPRKRHSRNRGEERRLGYTQRLHPCFCVLPRFSRLGVVTLREINEFSEGIGVVCSPNIASIR